MAVTWELGEHTPGKHRVLRRYLDAWYPILGMSQERILFIDGFAGPGEYAGGEPGSPIVAMHALRDHAARGRMKAEAVFLFVESDADRVAHLRRLVGIELTTLPPGTRVSVEHGKFDTTMSTVLDGLESKGQQLAPAFLMADPFGVSGTPLSVVQRVLRHPKSEVYISFMYEAISRFRGTDEFAPHLDGLFGTPDWRDGIGIVDAEQKKAFFFSLYRDRLKAAGATQVVHFELYKGARLIYAIFFGTKHLIGCDRMKQAIWGVAPFGDYAFRGAGGGQLGLELGKPDLARFGEQLRSTFSDREWVSIEELVDFGRSDRTDFHSSHLKPTLRRIDANGNLTRHPDCKAKARAYPPGTRVRFR